MEAGGCVGVRVPELHRNQLVAFQLEGVIGERLGEDEVLRDLAWEERVPERGESRRGRSVVHLLDDGGQGERLCAGEAFEDPAESEPVISVAVRPSAPSSRSSPRSLLQAGGAGA